MMRRVRLRSLVLAGLSLLLLLPGVLRAEETVCIQCHAGQPGPLGEPVELWRQSIHAANGISCHGCHGGDPTDLANAMDPERGFIGVPAPEEIPGFCGRCHVGVQEDYLGSAHGQALGFGGPQCVTCHGNHRVVAASPDLINPTDCSRCHSYGRAEEIKTAVVATDTLINDLGARIGSLHRLGIATKEMEGKLFALRNDFHRLFHSVEVEKVRQQTAGFQKDLGEIGERVTAFEDQLSQRKLWGGGVVALLLFGGILAVLLHKAYMEESKGEG